MKQTKKNIDSILMQEAFGFSAIIVLSWATEFLHVPYLLFDEAPAVNWHRALLRTGVIVVIWFWVHLTTRRLLKRLHHLEGFLHICSWCRKVGYDGKWLTIEEYFGSKFATETSHGICPECARLQIDKLATASPVPHPSV